MCMYVLVCLQICTVTWPGDWLVACSLGKCTDLMKLFRYGCLTIGYLIHRNFDCFDTGIIINVHRTAAFIFVDQVISSVKDGEVALCRGRLGWVNVGAFWCRVNQFLFSAEDFRILTFDARCITITEPKKSLDKKLINVITDPPKEARLGTTD